MGFLKKVNFRFTFWYRNLNMPNLCIGWLVGEVDGAAAASLLRLIVFNLLFFQIKSIFLFSYFSDKNGTSQLSLFGHSWKKKELLEPSGKV